MRPPAPAPQRPSTLPTPQSRALSRGVLLLAFSEPALSRAPHLACAASASGYGPLASRGLLSGGWQRAPLPTPVEGCGRGDGGSSGRSGGFSLWSWPIRGSFGAVAAGVSRAARQPAVVVVESPTKAKKIQGFLGDQYKVLASYGHVRDLPSREGSVRPEQGFSLEWQLLPAAGPRLEEIAEAAAGAPLLLLATDPDREGEAISWHIREELGRRGVLRRVGSVQRMTFTEITRSAITAALSGGRQVSQPLVDAYLARRALDYLVGFHLSPVLWRKLPGAKSAGRVQSVALRLVCEREAAVEAFTPIPYWSLEAHLTTPTPTSSASPSSPSASSPSASAATVVSRLTHVDGRRLGPLDISSGEMAERLAARIRSGPVVVSRVTSRPLLRNPAAPFTTASLQQEASRRLGFRAAKTMRVAQQLYEGAGTGEGLITYMRTDGVTLSAEAVEELRAANGSMYGSSAVPLQPRQYKSRAKNAQEAHEAIRPTRPASVTPASLPPSLDADQRALYELIWRRAVASQMNSAVYDVVTVEFSGDGGSLTLRSSGSLLRDAGFLRAYADLPTEDADEEPPPPQQQQGAEGGGGSEDEAALVPDREGADNGGPAAEQLQALQVGSALLPGPVLPSRHLTRPPPRFTEASLVRALEERGIGRPSTYAPTLSLLQDRGYVVREGRSLLPTSLGRVLTCFLEHYFPKYVDYDFTSDMEGQLDDVAAGRAAWRSVLTDFWGPFNSAVAAMGAIRTTQVYDMLDGALGAYFFRAPPAAGPPASLPPATHSVRPAASASDVTATEHMGAAPPSGGAADPRLCPRCGRGRLVLKPSRYGGFIGCSLYGDEEVRCGYARPMLRLPAAADVAVGGGEPGSATDSDGEAGGGEAPDSQAAAAAANATERLLGSHPETGEPVWVRLGPYGLYVQLGDSAPKKAPVRKKAAAKKAAGGKRGRKAKVATEAEAEEAGVEGVAEDVEAASKPRRAAIPKAKDITLHSVTLPLALGLLALPRTLGPHPEDGLPVVANTGPFGPYVAHNGLSASLGRNASAQEVDLQMAVQLLAAKRARQAARAAAGLPPTPTPTKGGRGRQHNAAGAPNKDVPSKGKGRGSAAYVVTRTRAGGSKGVEVKKVRVRGAKTGRKAGRGAEPSRPKSGYTLFLQQRWQEIKAAGSEEVPYREAVSRIAAEWRALGEDGQRRFSDSATEPAAAAPGATAAARGAVGSGRARRPRRTAAAAAPSAAPAAAAVSPSRRLNPYMQFCQHRRPELRASHPGAGLGEISKMLGAEWGALSEQQKAAYR